jgi:hypothetical protein
MFDVDDVARAGIMVSLGRHSIIATHMVVESLAPAGPKRVFAAALEAHLATAFVDAGLGPCG